MKTVRQLMQGKATCVHTIGPDDPVIEALRRMAAHEIGALPVVEQGQRERGDRAAAVLLSQKLIGRKVWVK